MQRLLLASLFCLGGALSTLWLPQDPAESDRPSADPPGQSDAVAAPKPGEEPAASSRQPQRSRPPARPRPEADLPTRDLVLRDDDIPTAVERILEVLDSRLDVKADDQPLAEFLETLARSGDFNLRLAEHLQADPESALRTGRVRISEDDIRLETLLDRLLEPVGLDWWIHDDALTIELPSVIVSQPEVHTYDVARLLRNGHTVESLQLVLERAGQDPQPPGKDPQRAVRAVCRITGGVAVLSAHQPAQRIAAGLLAEFDQLADDTEEQSPRARVIQGSPPSGRSTLARVRVASLRTARCFQRSRDGGQRGARVRRVAEDVDQTAPDPYQEMLDALEEPRDVDLKGVPWRDAVESLLKEAQIAYHVEDAPIAALDRAGTAGDGGQPTAGGVGNDAGEANHKVPRARELRQAPVRMVRRQSRLEAILNTILVPRQLAWLLLHDRLVITTAERAGRNFETKPYDVGNLLDSGHDERELTEAMREVVLRSDSAHVTGDSLVIRQTQEVHWRVAQVLAELDALAEEASQTEETPRDHFTWKAYRVPDGASEALLKLLPQLVAPESWLKDRQANSDRVGGELRAVPGLLLVKQTASRHQAIGKLLDQSSAPADPFR